MMGTPQRSQRRSRITVAAVTVALGAALTWLFFRSRCPRSWDPHNSPTMVCRKVTRSPMGREFTSTNWRVDISYLHKSRSPAARPPASPLRFAMLMSVISPSDRTQLLLQAIEGTEPGTFWAFPIPSGSPRRIGDLAGTNAAWSPDGEQIVYSKGARLYLAKADGSESSPLVSLPMASATLYGFRFSPDGGRIRFSVDNGDSVGLWEVRSNGSDLHRLLPGWHNPARECCGDWTTDGRYYVFLSGSGKANANVFALADHASILRGNLSGTGSTDHGAVEHLFGDAISRKESLVCGYYPVPRATGPLRFSISATLAVPLGRLRDRPGFFCRRAVGRLR